MTYGKITKKQMEILECIKQAILDKGYPPTVRELCDMVNLKSTSSIHANLEALERNGYIRRDPSKPRAIEIVDESFYMTKTDMPPECRFSPARISKPTTLFRLSSCHGRLPLC